MRDLSLKLLQLSNRTRRRTYLWLVLSAEQIRTDLYEARKISEALAAINDALTANPEEGERKALLAQRAWCHYHLKEHNEALKDTQEAGDHPLALSCRVHIRAYSANHRDDAELEELAGSLGNDISAANALLVRARQSDANLSHAAVTNLIQHFTEKDVRFPAQQDTKMGHLLHNGARFFLAKARNNRDLTFTIGLLDIALAHYGTISNWDHRAAAHFWLAQTLYKSNVVVEAFKAATASFLLWDSQLQLDPNNSGFKKGHAGAAALVGELTQQLQTVRSVKKVQS